MIPRHFLLCAIAFCLFAQQAYADDTMATTEPRMAPVEVMIIGLSHFSNPGKDMVNTKAVDVLAPEHQHALAVLSDVLAEFHPTAIVVEETTAAPGYISERYKSFDDKMLASVRNEIVQIGYRLARKTNLDAVYGIDEQPQDGEPDYFPFDKLQAHVDATGQTAALDQYFATFQQKVLEESEHNNSLSIPAALLNLNDPDTYIHGPALYYDLMNFDRGESQPAAELFGYFTMRNVKIFGKVMAVSRPGDKIIILYGAGHKYFLDRLVEDASGFTLVDPRPYLASAADKLKD